MPALVISQPAHNVPRTSPYGPILFETSRTKVRRIKFLTYFGSAVSNMVLASGNIGKKL